LANKGLKGITYEINGSTVGLQNALKEVNTKTRDLNSELKQVQRLLKLDPNNVTLLKQKQDLLNKSISETKDKLNTLKDAQSQVEQQFRNGDIGEEQYRSFQREIENTKQKLKQLEDQAKNTGSILGTHLQNAGEKISSAGQKISGAGQSLMPVTGAIVGIGTAAVVAGDNFEAQMSRVKAISGATGQDFEALRNQALQLGQDTAFSAGEVAEGMENLASAGFSTQEIMSAMPGMLDLAASSGEDLASSSDICASTLRGFGLAAGDAGHVADVLAKSSADTNASVASLGEAMKYIAPVANSAGWSLEQVTAAIGEMADQGIKGEQAGTTLRGALTNLMNPSSEAAKAMQSIGFSAYNSQGKMKPLSDIIADLNSKTKGLSNQQRDQVVSTIMGTNALSGMQVLLKDGSSNLDKLTASLKNSDGASKAMASTMQDNTKGSIEQMMGSIETAAIKIQTALAPTITNIANSITGLVNKFSSLDSAQQETIIKIAGIVAAVAPALLIVGKMTTGIGALTSGVGKTMTAVSNFQKVLKGGGTLAKAFSAALTPAGAVVAAVIAVTAVVALLVIGIKHLWDTNEGFRNTVTAVWNGIKTTITTVVNAIVGFFTTTIPGAWNGLVSLFNSIPAWWNGLWTQVGQFFTSLWNEIGNFFTATIPTWVNNFINFFATLPEKIGYIIGTVFASIVNFGVNAFNWVTTELPKIINGIINWFAQLPGKIWTWLLNTITKIKQWGTDTWNYLSQQIPKIINGIGTWFSGLPGKVWTWLLNTLDKVKTWCGNLVSTAGTEIPKFVAKVMEFIGELPGKMLDIGKNIVHGIWDGINGAISWLHDRISDFCSGIVKGFKDHLKIHSPSQIFADEVGRYMALGIGQGFIENMKSVASMMQASIPTNFDLTLGTSINGMNGLKTAAASANSYSYNNNTPINLKIKMGNITVQGNADEKVIAQMKQIAQDEVNKITRELKNFGSTVDQFVNRNKR
jgi:TP901 family phage tail tape measure protein